MTIDLFRVLLAAIDHGSFARTAAELGRTEGAVSKQIRQLEDQLDLVLFDRRNKPPLPTSHARDLIAAMRHAVAAYDAVQEDAALLSGTVRGEIRLGVIPTVTEWLLAPALVCLRESYPKLRVRIENGLSGALVEKLRHGRLDAAIVTRSSAVPASLRERLLVSEPIVLIAPAGIDREPASVLIRAQPIIRFNRAAGVGKIMDDLIVEMAPGRAAHIELDSIRSVIEMVGHGLGVALIPEPAALRFGKLGGGLPDVAVYPLDHAGAKRDIVFMESTKSTLSRTVETVFDAFSQVLAREPVSGD
jgi:DNA-binding transcriptional LysR family regulator